jgi:tRNA(fMet)-specific endonuclease VapC
MIYMLDTNTCITLIKQRSAKILKHFRSQSIGDIGISTITLAELRFGVEKSQAVERNRQALEEFLLPLEIADFDEKAAAEYGIVRTELEHSGTPIGPLDTQIGAHALSLGAVLVTNNTKEFKRINRLKVIDWTA